MFMPVPKLICLPLPCSFEGRLWVSATSGVVFRWNKMSYHRPQTIREMWYPWGSWHSKPKAILFSNAGPLSIPRKRKFFWPYFFWPNLPTSALLRWTLFVLYFNTGSQVQMQCDSERERGESNHRKILLHNRRRWCTKKITKGLTIPAQTSLPSCLSRSVTWKIII